MANKKVSLILVLLFMILGILEAQTDNRLNGIWTATHTTGAVSQLILNNGSYEYSIDFDNVQTLVRGTYTTRGNLFIRTPSHMHGSSFSSLGLRLGARWYSQNELRYTVNADLFTLLSFYFLQTTHTYNLRGNTLILTTSDNITITYTRR